MNKTCLLFSGQGSQYQGMGKEILSLFPDLEFIYTRGSEILGFDLKTTCFEASAEDLAKTEISQPAIFATALLCYEAVKKLGITPDAVAGHSLGEYAAMVAAGILSLEDGFQVIKARAKAMGDCAKGQDGAMCAVLGLSAEEIAAVCESVEGYVIPVNFNSPAQTVIAGEREAVDKAIEKFTEMGKRTMKLAVSAAFHSKLMQSGADAFYDAIKDVAFHEPTVPFYSNVTGAQLTDFSDMPTYLKTHLVSPVQFVKELNAIQETGVDRFIECGPNKVLAGLVKKTLTDVTIFNVENEKTFSKLKGE
ncbi:ACP S-malonyltransferase [Paludicola sp. MB14-C6]|uniref:ACP S-malonyltransferase n=1 Tax=Paludihabitans sp. MB14-C6 TaxID=3070656 RepID=UPI0027DC1F42|nr:ACP S-malonyltransferase [Paludicola sp. MB14-C6]WMJ21868.1 ACP S-malonyltransferase [Paludicola sp. MB14-C6]